MNVAALDVFYTGDKAKAVCLQFGRWTDMEPSFVSCRELYGIRPYQPGLFYLRELPCLLAVLNETPSRNFRCLVVDGYVYLDDQKRKGLGASLYEAREGLCPVIGVAKTRFKTAEACSVAVYRGGSTRPLFVSAAGMETEEAAALVGSMAGEYRIPLLLKELDRLTREKGPCSVSG